MMDVQTFEVYFVEGKLHGYEIDHKPYPASASGYEFTHFLSGKSAAFCIVTHDGDINRDIAIGFALAVHTGKFTTHRVDLSGLTDVKAKNGKRLW